MIGRLSVANKASTSTAGGEDDATLDTEVEVAADATTDDPLNCLCSSCTEWHAPENNDELLRGLWETAEVEDDW